jgi:hypothetical protein
MKPISVAELSAFKGLNLDDARKTPGCAKKLINFNVLQDGTYETRKGIRAVSTSIDSLNLKCRGAFELIKDDNTRYQFVDNDHNSWSATVSAPDTQPTLSEFDEGGDSSSISEPEFHSDVNKELIQARSRVSEACWDCQSKQWPDRFLGDLNWVVVVDDLDGGTIDPLTGKQLPSVKVSKDNGVSWYRTGVPLFRPYPYSHSDSPYACNLFANIGKCSKAGAYLKPYEEIQIAFNGFRDLLLGETWSFSMSAWNTLTMGITHDISAPNDLSSGGTYTGDSPRTILIKIDGVDSPNTFKYSYTDGETWEDTEVEITGSAQNLDDGVTITFGSTTDHLLDSYWYIYCVPAEFPKCTDIPVYYTYMKKNGDLIEFETNPSPVNTISPSANGKGINATHIASVSGDITHIGFYKGLSWDITDIRLAKTVENATGNTDIDVSDYDIQEARVLISDREGTDTVTRVMGSLNSSTDEKILLGSQYIISPELDSTGNPIPCYINANNRAYRFDGVNPNYSFEDISSEPRLVGLTPPDEALLTGLTDGNYRYYYIYLREETDRVTRSNPSPCGYSNSTSVKLNVKASEEIGVNKIRCYRSLKDFPTVHYLLGEYDNVSATISVNLSDALIRGNEVLEFDNYKPYTCRYGMVVSGVMIYGYIPEEEISGGFSWVVPSKIGEYEHMTNNVEQFDPRDGDVITGFGGPVQGKAIVFKRRKTFYYDPINMQQLLLSAQIGCLSHRSIQNIGDNAVIYLSAEGIILFDGSNFINLSRTKKDSQGNVISGGINSVIMQYIRTDDPSFCDSAYISKTKSYHLLLKDPDNIENQRYFVVGLESGQWSEYKFYDTDGNRIYVNAVSKTADGYKNESISFVMTADGYPGVLDIYQGEYDEEPISLEMIADQVGEREMYCPTTCIVDDDDNVFVGEENLIVGSLCSIFKVDSNNDVTKLFGEDEIEAVIKAFDGAATSPILSGFTYSPWMLKDDTYIYWVQEYTYLGDDHFYYALMKYALTGTPPDQPVCCCRFFSWDSLDAWFDQAKTQIDSSGNIYVPYSQWTGEEEYFTGHIIKITDPGGSPSYSTIFDCDENIAIIATSFYDDYIYVFLANTETGALEIGKISTSGEYTSIKELDNDIEWEYWGSSRLTMHTVSDTEIYFTIEGVFYSLIYGTSWITKEIYNSSSINVTQIFGDSNGIIYLYDLVNHGFYVYWKDFRGDGWQKLKRMITASGDGTNSFDPIATYPVQMAGFRSDDTVILLGYNSQNIFSVSNSFTNFMSDFLEGNERFCGVVGEASFYAPMDSKRKSIRGANIITDSLYSVGGILSVMPDDRTNYSIHSPHESSVPDGALSASPFAAPGIQDWQAGEFTERLGTRVNHRLDLSGIGNEFFFNLKIGNISESNKGQIKVIPPGIKVQDLGTD